MAIKRDIEKTRLILAVETGESNENGPVVKNVTITKIKNGADDAVLFAAGDAMGSLLAKNLSAVRRVDTVALSDGD